MIGRDKILRAVDTLGELTLLEYCSSVGGEPAFERPKSPGQLLTLAKKIASTINQDRTWNGRSKHAENYALCLAHNKEYRSAYQLFHAIIRGKKEVLATPSRNKMFEEVACKPGKLGYEGAFQFALVCLKFKDEEGAIKLLLEIVTKVPTRCYPIRLQDIRVEALEKLIRRGVAEHQGKDLRKEFEAAKEHQY